MSSGGEKRSVRRSVRALAPRRRDAIRHALRPGWTRTILIRRSAAVVLLLVAAVVAVAEHRADTGHLVVVAATDLLPGQRLDPEDLAQRSVPGPLIPPGALRVVADGSGRTVTGRVRAGEMVTDARLLSPQLPAELTGRPDARLVPVRLADDAVVALLREGDVVDVLTEDADLLARRAIVALHLRPDDKGPLSAGTSSSPPVLLAMDESSAHRVAAAGLDAALAVVLH